MGNLRSSARPVHGRPEVRRERVLRALCQQRAKLVPFYQVQYLSCAAHKLATNKYLSQGPCVLCSLSSRWRRIPWYTVLAYVSIAGLTS